MAHAAAPAPGDGLRPPGHAMVDFIAFAYPRLRRREAWATSPLNLKAVIGGGPLDLTVRPTWILDKHDGRWVIAHFHKAVAVGEGSQP